MDDIDEIEKILADSNKGNVALIGDGLTKQYFIELEHGAEDRGRLYDYHVSNNSWLTPFSIEIAAEDSTGQAEIVDRKTSIKDSAKSQLFETEVDEKVLADAKKILTIKSELTSSSICITDAAREMAGVSVGLVFGVVCSYNYFFEKGEQIRENLVRKANSYFEKSLSYFLERNYEAAIERLNKAFFFNPLNLNYFLLKLDCFLQLADFKSSLLTINKILSLVAVTKETGAQSEDELKLDMHERTVFCHYMLGQVYYDLKCYYSALEEFKKAIDLCPGNNLAFKVRSVSCLFEMSRFDDSLYILNQIINEHDDNMNNCNLFILRARINLKNNNITESYFDLKRSLNLDPTNKEAQSLMNEILDTAENLRNTALVLSLNNRLKEALVKINGAIRLNPDKPEYNLQRGVLYKRSRDFNTCIDDFLNGLQKIRELGVNDEQLVANFRRQILLTYNEFAILCYERGFNDEAIILLNKAIRQEKNEKGFYINRGDCFYKKNEKNFALLDYEQAFELDSSDQTVSNRIANIYYEYGVAYYDEKNYSEATKNFSKCIEYAPGNCKYFISRARTRFLCEDITSAQIDICVSIILDPVNPEIPAIITRIFAKNNLSEVLESKQMQEARYFLKKLNVKNLFDIDQSLRSSQGKDLKPKAYHHIQPSPKKVAEEEKVSLELVARKDNIKAMLKEGPVANLKNDRPVRLAAPEPKREERKNPKDFIWRKFNTGIGAF